MKWGPAARTAITFLIVSLALVVTGANFSKHQDVLERMDAQVAQTQQDQEEEDMQKATTTWVSGGATQTVSTPRQEAETDAAWAARHKASVDAFKAAFPVDPPAGG